MNIEEYKKQCTKFLLNHIRGFLLRHYRMINQARFNHNWIDWVYDVETDSMKRTNIFTPPY